MDDWLTEQMVIARTGTTGRRLTWLRQNGLIPQPRRRSRGLHKGTVTWYPPITVEMIRRIDALTTETRFAEEWRWRLWLEGFPINIVSYLVACIDATLAPLTSIHDAEELDSVLLTTRGRRSRVRNFVPAREAALRVLYDRVRVPDRWYSLLSWAAGIALGFDAIGTEGWDTVKRAFNLSNDFAVPPIDKSNASVAVLRETLSNMSPDEIEQARKDMSVVSGLADWLRHSAEARHAPELLKFFRRAWDEFTFRAMLIAFLTMLRRSPETADGVDKVINTIKWLSPRLETPSAGVETDAV